MRSSEAMYLATIIDCFLNIDEHGRQVLLALSKGFLVTKPKQKAQIFNLFDSISSHPLKAANHDQ